MLKRNKRSQSGLSWFKRSRLSILGTMLLCASQGAIANEQVEKNANEEPVVAYHVDFRVQVMPIEALKAMAKEVASLGFNTIIMEWEASYPYKKHSIISNQYAYSRKEVKQFIEYSEGLGLDVIPLQQNFGHAEYILMHERYAYLRADARQLSQIDPTRLDAARDLFEELFDDMFSTHNSEYVHIGGDETRLLDCKNCQDAWGDLGEEAGKSKIYVDYMKMIAEIVTERGKTPLIWADMILKHPEAIKDMPKNVIYIDWNYGWDFDRFGSDPRDLIKQYDLQFWGAPSIRSGPDDYHSNSWEKHLNNMADYIPEAKKAGYTGMVLTSWSTSGEYGYNWFSGEVETVEIYPIRQVYPHSYPNDAFRMSTSAFITAIEQEEPIKVKGFTRQYAKERFGLTAPEATKLWNILSSEVMNNKVVVGSVKLSGVKGLTEEQRQLAQVTLDKVRESQAQLKQIVPTINEEEFSHYILQLDLREFWLNFRVIQGWVQSEEFTRKDRNNAVEMLEALLEKGEELNERFEDSFSGALYDSEIEVLNEYRNHKIEMLLERLSNER
ncbi:family 20 glycosylhydrolase [Vibrio scophthalmi]|uniref:Beta-N-acetylhexosaminidase n=1 Tax=Vibrio scophthalmi TaxID=45658 RepID=A0A1E3WI77_9VIBR|nr:family 20 glycosylhydrolase [Vibrio scophthalmi]MCY9802494.1 family 20 glycosylhydrolase [Vibrio scophthalmi]ODS05508.1 Beta-N-acetylhexosaminidase [Vibrio scophthalmi]